MLWELMEPCPPGNPEDFTKDQKYHRAVQSGSNNNLIKSCLLRASQFEFHNFY